MSINPNENSILTRLSPVPDVRLGYTPTGQSQGRLATRWPRAAIRMALSVGFSLFREVIPISTGAKGLALSFVQAEPLSCKQKEPSNPGPGASTEDFTSFCVEIKPVRVRRTSTKDEVNRLTPIIYRFHPAIPFTEVGFPALARRNKRLCRLCERAPIFLKVI